jgi:glycosyltransferase involved in cell wall biosynthesis
MMWILIYIEIIEIDKIDYIYKLLRFPVIVEKLSIIIPVYNEKKYFIKLLKKVLSVKLPIDREIIIVESGSKDGSHELAQKYVHKKGFKVIFEPRPMGKGHALKAGFKAATGTIILVQDADLEYDPNDYPKLLAPILKGETKFVLGSRKLGRNIWKTRSHKTGFFKAAFINVISTLADGFFNLLYNVRLTDTQTMYKVFRRECLKGIRFESNHFNLDFEICARLIRRGYIPIEVPIIYNSRGFDEGKKINILRDVFINTFTVIKFRFVK